ATRRRSEGFASLTWTTRVTSGLLDFPLAAKLVWERQKTVHSRETNSAKGNAADRIQRYSKIDLAKSTNT
ncbi:MAG: hypothetical protein EBU49_02220, partial [Proteobacteria bacterium]|nr:hypothetical protein [Pseudomonadota bacterium]